MPTPIKIEPPWVRVDLNRDPVLGTCCEHFLSGDLVARTAQQLPSGHMPEDRRVGIGHRADDAFGLRCAVHVETAVHARHDKVERFQHLIRVIKRAIRENVGFDTLEDAEALSTPPTQAISFRLLLGDFLLTQSARVVRRPRMITDTEVLISAAQRGLGHRLKRIETVGAIGMRVEDPGDIDR
jgi:hypothetical protein